MRRVAAANWRDQVDLMNVEQTRRRSSQWMIVTTAMLALAVFSWGVRYKVSLYNPSTHMSAAKLLSQRERPATSESAKLVAGPAVNLQRVTFFSLAMGVMLAWVWSLKPVFSPRSARNRTELPKQPGQTFFFFRPPPIVFAAR